MFRQGSRGTCLIWLCVLTDVALEYNQIVQRERESCWKPAVPMSVGNKEANACTHVCTCTHMHAHTCTHTYTHTHARTHAQISVLLPGYWSSSDVYMAWHLFKGVSLMCIGQSAIDWPAQMCWVYVTCHQHLFPTVTKSRQHCRNYWTFFVSSPNFFLWQTVLVKWEHSAGRDCVPRY